MATKQDKLDRLRERMQADTSLPLREGATHLDRKSTRLNSSHQIISYAVFCLKKKKKRSTLIHAKAGHPRKSTCRMTNNDLGTPHRSHLDTPRSPRQQANLPTLPQSTS